MNSQVHDGFDKFKKAEALKDYSLLESLELLDLWCSSRKSSRVTVNKFSKQYIWLHSTEIDSLCRWVMELRESFDILGEAALQIHNAESSATSSLQTLQNDPIACVKESPNAPSETSKEDNTRVLTKISGLFNYYNYMHLY